MRSLGSRGSWGGAMGEIAGIAAGAGGASSAVVYVCVCVRQGEFAGVSTQRFTWLELNPVSCSKNWRGNTWPHVEQLYRVKIGAKMQFLPQKCAGLAPKIAPMTLG